MSIGVAREWKSLHLPSRCVAAFDHSRNRSDSQSRKEASNLELAIQSSMGGSRCLLLDGVVARGRTDIFQDPLT